MGDEPFTTQRGTSTKTSGSSWNPLRMAYATERAQVLFGSYRRGDANDPDRYVTAIAAVLSSYEPSLIQEVTDPNTGIAATEKFMTFMPNAGELKVYCDAMAARRERVQRLGKLPRADFTRLSPPRPGPGDLATVFVPAAHNRYDSLVEWSKTAHPMYWKFEKRPGIWVSYDVWDQRHTAAKRLSDYAKPVVEAAEEAAQSREAAE